MTKVTNEEMIKRYVYDVARRLPAKNRADIEKELESNIHDMLDARKPEGGCTVQDVEEVLVELGKPSDLAASYKDQRRGLITGVYFDQYCFILKIVLLAVALGMSIAQGISLAMEPPATIAEGVGIFIYNLVMAVTQGFAWVTIIFFFVQRYNVKLDMDAWKPADLPPVPVQQAVIKKSEPIVGIVFIVIVMLLFNVAPQFFSVGMGIVHTAAGEAVSFFNMDVLQSSLLLINACFVLGILREVIRVVSGRYTVKLAVIVTILNMASLGLILAALLNPAIWNAQGAQQVMDVFGFTEPLIGSVLGAFPIIFIGILVFAFVLDSATTFYKGIRYGRE